MINKLLEKTWFPLIFQFVTLLGFIFLVVLGFQANIQDMALAKILRNTNLANLIVWSYWWPLLILSAIFLGRVWCSICPMELLTSLASKFGLKRKPPRFIRSGWIITLFYIIILFVGIHTFAIHRVPWRMALYMLFLLSIALLSGFIFERNTFCASLCPVGHLLGLYARLSPMGWGVRNPSICEECTDLSCISKKNAYDFQGRSCGVGLRPLNLLDNTQCLLCGQCLKACDRHNVEGIEGRPNPGWFYRGWFKDLLTLRPLTAPQVTFALVVSGFVIYEVFTEWKVTKHLLLWLPQHLAHHLQFAGHYGYTLSKIFLIFILLPLLVWGLPWLIFRLLGGKLPMSHYFLNFGIAFIPIMAAAHATKALLKTTSRLPYWQLTFSDPIGLKTAHQLLEKQLELAPLPFWRESFISFAGPSLLIFGTILSIIIIRKLIIEHLPQSGWRATIFYLIPLLYGGSFTLMMTSWRWGFLPL